MKKTFLFIFSLCFVSLSSQTDFRIDIDIETLDQFTESDWKMMIDGKTQVLLEGAFVSLKQISEEPVVFQGNLINGKWINIDELKEYNVNVHFEGEKWTDMITNRRNPDQIKINNLVRIFGYFSGTPDDPVFIVSGVK